MKITKRLELKAYYTIPELAKIGGIPDSYHALRRMLVTNGVEFIKGGRSFYVPLSEIEAKLPHLWESLKIMDELRGQRYGSR